MNVHKEIPYLLFAKAKILSASLILISIWCIPTLVFAEQKFQTDLLGKPALQDERIGLFNASDFQLTTGQCTSCFSLRQALWYFENETIVVPKSVTQSQGLFPTPFLVWLGAPEILEHVEYASTGNGLKARNGTQIPFRLVQKIPSNRSYFDSSSAEFFQQRPVRIRGKTETLEDQQIFNARMIWPEDYRLGHTTLSTKERPSDLSNLIEQEDGSTEHQFSAEVLWEKNPGLPRDWMNRPVVALMLNGAQGDDDEAQGGHFALVTGRVGPQGEMADWMVNNFYNLDMESEKGIIPAMLPMDQYLMDLNSGQSYYRPSYLLIAVLRQDRTARYVQTSTQKVFEAFYRHDFLYDHSKANCAGLSLDILRDLGWNIPHKGPTSYLKAAGAYVYVSATEQSVSDGKKVYDYLTEEQTRQFPRMAFETAGQDLMDILDENVSHGDRRLTVFENMLKKDVEAIVFVRIPQIPSSRAFGTYPVATFDEYQARVPKDRSEWQTVSVNHRPFPKFLREPRPVVVHQPFEHPPNVWMVFPIGLVATGMLVRTVRSRNRQKKNL